MARRGRAGVVLGMIICVSMVAAGSPGRARATARLSSVTRANSLSFLWVQPLRNHPVHRLMQAGFLNECKKLKANCVVVGNPSATNYDVPGTVALAEAALAGAHYTCVAAYDPVPSINPFIKKIGAEGYPVVTWHVLPKQGTVPGLLAATGENIPQVGQAAAMAIGKKLGGKGIVAITQGSFNDTENAMNASFRATMKASFPAVKILETQVEGFEPSAAVAKAISIIQANTDVAAAFSTTGNGPQTWYDAQRQSGHKLVIIGMDYIRHNLDLVQSGKVYGLAAQPLYPEAAKAADLCAALSRGKKVPYYNYLPASIITKGQLAPYYGYLKAAGV